MPHFNIIRKNQPVNTFRVSKVCADFDVKFEHSNERFEGDINLPEHWNIGAIVGKSGTGKTTIAKEIFGDHFFSSHNYTASSVIDDMPKDKTVEEITRMFYSCGFGSVPSWLKPYSVLSNGEKMRVDLAKALLCENFVVFDEFTSVIDRNVAQTCCIATNKAVRKLDKQFIAVSCHFDILDWLQPDWVFDTDQMKFFFGQSLAPKSNSISNNVGEANGRSLGVIII
jgi:ABC-type ATPase with predicted acetyltransferase domain